MSYVGGCAVAVSEDVLEDVSEDIGGYIGACGMYQWMSCHNVISLWPDLQKVPRCFVHLSTF